MLSQSTGRRPDTALHAHAKDFAATNTFDPQPDKAVDLLEALAKSKPTFFIRIFGSM